MLTRRRFLRLSGAVLTTASLLPALPGRHRAGDFQTIRRGVGIFTERGGTIGWLATDDALVIVDTQFPDTAAVFWDGLQERTSRAADLVINTHHHGDHTAGNPFFEAHTDRIVAHANVPALQRQAAENNDNADEQVYPSETFDTTWSETVGNETVRLRHYGPAHTGGDCVIHFEQANVAHVGDLVFNRLLPFVDLDGGASTLGWIEVLEGVLGDFDDDTRFIFGHGNPAFGITGNRTDLMVMRDFFDALVTHVQQGIDAGASIETIADRTVLPGFEDYHYEDWALSLDACIRIVHRDLTGALDEGGR